MKALTLYLLLGLVVCARCYLIKVPTTPIMQSKIVPIEWVQMQKLILPLFENICEESNNPIIVNYSQDFKFNTTNADYTSPEVINNILDLKTDKGFLPKKEIFTEYNIEYLDELKAIYDLFYYANDFNSFYKAACWARQNINCGLFVDALYSAILNRKDTEKIFIPAPYEILPNYFVRKDFIIKASSLIYGGETTAYDGIRIDGNSYITDVNYTTQFYEDSDEAKLVYFYEDVGLNSYYYLTKLKMSSWTNTQHSNNGYGEYLYSMIKQLMARYNLERYANGLPEVESIDWDCLDKLPYYNPMLVYSDGNDFSYRVNQHIENNEKLTLLKNIENNVGTVVTHMREGGFHKSDILNHLMEILVTGTKSYENLALQILNDDTAINNRSPSVLGHYMTTLRDPAFWVINKKMVDIVDKALKVLPGYTKDDLYFPGVEIINVEVKKMITFFDNFTFDVTDALKTSEDTNFKIKISQSRLNHKPFSIKVNITSLVSQKSLLRIYIGPKIMPGEYALKKNLFMLLDCFEINLKYGNNIITRSSTDISVNSDDLLSLHAIRKTLADVQFGLNSITKLKPVNEQIRFPSRLMIPKGVVEGLPIQLFVFVVPFGKTLSGQLLNTEINKDVLLSRGFPLDLDVEVQQLFDLPNALVKDIFVIQKESDDKTNYGGRPDIRSWQNNYYHTSSEPVTLPLSARPDFTMRKEPFDYKSKRGQYEKNEDYAAMRGEYKYKKDYNTAVDKPLVSNSDLSTNKINIYIPDINKDNFEYVVTTDRPFGEGYTFTLDKKILNKINTEEIQMDVMSKEEIVLDKLSKDIDGSFHKAVIKNGVIGPYDETVTDKTTKDSDKIIWNKAKEHIIIDVTTNERNLPEVMLENFDEKTNYKYVDINENIDISKGTGTNKRIPSIYDLVYYPFHDFIGPDENVYE